MILALNLTASLVGLALMIVSWNWTDLPEDTHRFKASLVVGVLGASALVVGAVAGLAIILGVS